MYCDLCKKEIKTNNDLRTIFGNIPQEQLDNYAHKRELKMNVFRIHTDCFNGLKEFFRTSNLLDPILANDVRGWLQRIMEVDSYDI